MIANTNTRTRKTFIILNEQFKTLLSNKGKIYPFDDHTFPPLMAFPIRQGRGIKVLVSDTSTEAWISASNDGTGDKLLYKLHPNGSASISTIPEPRNIMHPVLRELNKTYISNNCFNETLKPVKVWKGENYQICGKPSSIAKDADFTTIDGCELIVIYEKIGRGPDRKVKIIDIVGRGQYSAATTERFEDLMQDFRCQPTAAFRHLLNPSRIVVPIIEAAIPEPLPEQLPEPQLQLEPQPDPLPAMVEAKVEAATPISSSEKATKTRILKLKAKTNPPPVQKRIKTETKTGSFYRSPRNQMHKRSGDILTHNPFVCLKELVQEQTQQEV
jgi:hypothetical protein